MKTPEVEIK